MEPAQAEGPIATFDQTHEAPRFYGANQSADPKRGDFILTKGDAWTSKLIRFGQRLRFRGTERSFAGWNHAALVVSEDGLVEALGAGVMETALSKYRTEDYFHVPLKDISEDDRDQIVAFGMWAAGRRTPAGEKRDAASPRRIQRAGYAFLIIANLAIALLLSHVVVSTLLMVGVLVLIGMFWTPISPLWVVLTVVGFQVIPKINISFSGEFICSGLVARALERGGFIFGRRPVSHLMPADLALAFDVNLAQAASDSEPAGERDR